MFYVRKQSKGGGDVINMIILTIYIVTTGACMWLCDGITLVVGRTFDPVVFLWLYIGSQYDPIFF